MKKKALTEMVNCLINEAGYNRSDINRMAAGKWDAPQGINYKYYRSSFTVEDLVLIGYMCGYNLAFVPIDEYAEHPFCMIDFFDKEYIEKVDKEIEKNEKIIQDAKTDLVVIRPVNKDFILTDYKEEIEEAVKFASCNLLKKHHIAVPYDAIKFYDSRTLVLSVTLPEGMDIDSFNPSARLSCIALYLTWKHPELKKYFIDKRLFSYQVLKKEEDK